MIGREDVFKKFSHNIERLRIYEICFCYILPHHQPSEPIPRIFSAAPIAVCCWLGVSLWQRSGGTGQGSHIVEVGADNEREADRQRLLLDHCGQNSKWSVFVQCSTACEEPVKIKVTCTKCTTIFVG